MPYLLSEQCGELALLDELLCDTMSHSVSEALFCLSCKIKEFRTANINSDTSVSEKGS